MTEIPKKPNRILSISERAEYLREQWNLPPSREDIAQEPKPVGADWMRRGKERGLMESFVARNPEYAPAIQKAATREALEEIRKLLDGAQVQEAEIRQALDELHAERGTKKAAPRMIAKGIVQCGYWGCTLAAAGKRHEHVAGGGVIGWEE